MTAAELARALTGDLDAILAKALATDPADRYSSAEAFAADLDRYSRLEPIEARRIGNLTRTVKFVRRHRLSAGLAAALALASALGLGGVLWQSARTASEARRANATKEFLIGVFQASDPRVAGSRPRGAITARELLDLAARRLETELALDPATRSELSELTATIYTYLDELDPARRIARAVSEERHARLAPDDPELLDSLMFEVWIALQAGDAADAGRRLDELDRHLARRRPRPLATPRRMVPGSGRRRRRERRRRNPRDRARARRRDLRARRAARQRPRGRALQSRRARLRPRRSPRSAGLARPRPRRGPPDRVGRRHRPRPHPEPARPGAHRARAPGRGARRPSKRPAASSPRPSAWSMPRPGRRPPASPCSSTAAATAGRRAASFAAFSPAPATPRR